MAIRRYTSGDGEAARSSLWAVFSWLVITLCAWLIGLLVQHPWAGLSMGLFLGFLSRDYFEGKSLWTLAGFGCWIVGVALHHPWLGFFAAFGLTAALLALGLH